MDFSNQLFRCSSLGYIMSEATGKTNSQLYQEACLNVHTYSEKNKKYKAEYDAIKNKETKTADNKMEQLLKAGDNVILWDKEAKRLVSIKDKIELSETCKTHLVDLWIVIRWGKHSSLKDRSKYIKKGNALEQQAITNYSILMESNFKKSDEYKFNNWIDGHHDFNDEGDIVFDTKVSWDSFTFYRNLGKPINKIYWWQLQGYMWLWGFKKAKLVYSLINTPENMIVAEEKSLLYSQAWGSKEEYEEACFKLRKNHIHDDIPDDYKILEYEIEADEECRERIQAVVDECRNYLNEIDSNHAILHNKLKLAT